MPMLTPKPIHRSSLRMALGRTYFRLKRWAAWHLPGTAWASERAEPSDYPHVLFTHRTPLLRRLKNVEMWLQANKVINLRIAAASVNAICLRPGERFSYWRLIGNPTARRGFLPGMVLHIYLTDTHLVGEWRSDRPLHYRYHVYEAAHEIRSEPWGGYTRHNALRRRVYNEANEQVDDQFITENHAIMMYEPLLEAGGKR